MPPDFARTATEQTDGSILVAEPDLSNGDALPAWSQRTAFTIPAGAVDARLVDFPVPVMLTSSNHNFAGALDGQDIRFSLKDEPTDADWLPLFIANYDPGQETALLWTRLPIIETATATTFYMFLGDDEAGAYSTDVFSPYELAVLGGDVSGMLVPLACVPVGKRSSHPGRHKVTLPIADVRANFGEIDCTGLAKATAHLLIEIQCSRPEDMIDTLPDEVSAGSNITDPEAMDFKGGIGISSEEADQSGSSEEWWRAGIKDLGLTRQWKYFDIPLSDWINRSSTALTGTVDTDGAGTAVLNHNGSDEIQGTGTLFNSELSDTPGSKSRILARRGDYEYILKVETIDDDTTLHVQGYSDNVGDNVGFYMNDRTIYEVTSNDDLDVTELRHVRVVGHFVNKNAILEWRNARLAWDDAAGNRVLDISGKENHLVKTVITNGVQSDAGILDKAMQFGGAGYTGRLQISRWLDIGGSSFTLSAWIKAGSTATSLTLMGCEDFSFVFTDDALTISWEGFQATLAFQLGLFDENWHHVVIVQDRHADSCKLFVDGEIADWTESALPDQNISHFVYIGGDETPATTETWEGLIAEVRLLKAAMPAEWIKAEYDAALDVLVSAGDIYTPAATPDGVVIPHESGGTLYVT